MHGGTAGAKNAGKVSPARARRRAVRTALIRLRASPDYPAVIRTVPIFTRLRGLAGAEIQLRMVMALMGADPLAWPAALAEAEALIEVQDARDRDAGRIVDAAGRIAPRKK